MNAETAAMIFRHMKADSREMLARMAATEHMKGTKELRGYTESEINNAIDDIAEHARTLTVNATDAEVEMFLGEDSPSELDFGYVLASLSASQLGCVSIDRRRSHLLACLG